jgi:hypothetical protein
MKKNISIVFLLLIILSTKGQTQKYRLVNNDEQQVINDLCSTLIDTTRLMVISPLIDTPIINLGDETLSRLDKKYGFDINQFECLPGDTLFIKQNPKLCGNYSLAKGGFRLFKDSMLIKDNKYFHVLSVDTLAKYSRSNILEFVKHTHSGKLHRICRFSKIVFSRDKKYAVVDYSIECGHWCFDGATVLMEQLDNKWVVVEKLIVKFA